jgi:hypothetical protein
LADLRIKHQNEQIMNLKKGIRLHNLFADGDESVFINSGTIPYAELPLDKVNYKSAHFTPLYEEDAYLPKRDWRRLSDPETDQIRPAVNRATYNTIYAGDIPESLKESIVKLDLTNSVNREAVMTKFNEQPELVKGVSEEMHKFLLTISDGKPFHFHCIAANLPNLETVACDVTRLPPNFSVPDKKYIGLHNDGTQYMNFYTTHKSGNRITINLGKESRIFYFVNLTMIQVVNMLKQKVDIKKDTITIHNIAPFFFRYFPDYPVIKILQRPYQYYIAPTDNAFHDGSTAGNTALDINMVYFGAFKC